MNTFLFYVGSGKCPPGGGVNVTIKNWKLLRKKARSAPAVITYERARNKQFPSARIWCKLVGVVKSLGVLCL